MASPSSPSPRRRPPPQVGGAGPMQRRRRMGLRILGNAKSESKRLSPLVERVRESGTRRLSRGSSQGRAGLR